jgi:DNA-binding IclR family transcriptional regulator
LQLKNGFTIVKNVRAIKDPNGYNVRAVERALQILSCFDDRHPEKGVSEIAQAMGLHKATTHRIMTTLLNYGYLERTADGQKYRLGLAVAELGYRVIRRLDLRREALPYMTQLVQQFDEACDLSVFDHSTVFYVHVIQGHHALTIAAAVGQRLPVHCTASGKIMLAFLPHERRKESLSQPLVSFTDKTITSRSELERQLEGFQQQGYGFDDEEYEAGIRAVAAPILNRDGQAIAAISMPGPTGRMTLDRIPEIAGALKQAASEISSRMGWTA